MLVARDLRLAARRRVDVVLPIAFFTVAVSLFPLGVGPEPQNHLRQIAPGVVWVAALLAAMLSVTQLYAADHADGSLEQMLLVPGGRLSIVVAKAVSHWLLTGLPLVVAAPLFGILFDMTPDAIASLVVGLVLGTPVLSLLGGLGAALTLGLRGGAVLLILIIVALHSGADLRCRRGRGGRIGAVGARPLFAARRASDLHRRAGADGDRRRPSHRDRVISDPPSP